MPSKNPREPGLLQPSAVKLRADTAPLECRMNRHARYAAIAGIRPSFNHPDVPVSDSNKVTVTSNAPLGRNLSVQYRQADALRDRR